VRVARGVAEIDHSASELERTFLNIPPRIAHTRQTQASAVPIAVPESEAALSECCHTSTSSVHSALCPVHSVAPAVRTLLQKPQLTLDDFDLVELNEGSRPRSWQCSPSCLSIAIA
jgi:hypothetical protein